MAVDEANIRRAARAIRAGDAVIFPTETVYGLGADALDPEAIERVFALKGRSRDKPLSLGVPDVETALTYTNPTDRERRFMDEFLPGPVTVIVERKPAVPDELTGGLDRVGIRIPDHDVALALLREVEPVTATSANVSGQPSAHVVTDIGPDLRDAVAVVLDDGETRGTESTVVDVEAGVIHRRGTLADDIEAWLREE
ncbi:MULTISPECIES: L-threonylcarbamoyladenylate synthase [unclassified Haladaptatus]|uniref:L-threonylcarbamoyladenylate synthase n=1 Tax=unclassified Haladaptatus TaxID=2622732 RepID=UPI0023E84FBE|nr:MULTISPECIES: L-threonylcarbamoyladenylate synthase [unclassified Haladaptatus]